MRTIQAAEPGKPVTRISALKFQRKFGEARQRALHEPIEITRHGRRELVLMTTDHYDGLVAAARRAPQVAGSAQPSPVRPRV